MPDVSSLKKTFLGPHVLVRPIELPTGEKVGHVLVNSTIYNVGEVFTPTAYWKGKFNVLFQRGYVKAVADLKRDAELDALHAVRDALVTGDEDELVRLMVTLDVLPDAATCTRGELCAAAEAVLRIKGVALDVPAKADATPQPDAPAPTAPASASALQAAYDAEDYNGLGTALAALGVDVPKKKDERIAAAKALLEGDDE